MKLGALIVALQDLQAEYGKDVEVVIDTDKQHSAEPVAVTWDGDSSVRYVIIQGMSPE